MAMPHPGDTPGPAGEAVEKLAYRPSEAAAALGISRSALYELMAAHKIAYRQVSPQVRLIARATIDAFLAGTDAP